MNCVACGKKIDLVICGTCGKAALPPVRVEADVRISECDLEEARRFAMATLQTEEERNGASFMYGALLKRFLRPNAALTGCEAVPSNGVVGRCMWKVNVENCGKCDYYGDGECKA